MAVVAVDALVTVKVVAPNATAATVALLLIPIVKCSHPLLVHPVQ